jgi:hypothetical protein
MDELPEWIIVLFFIAMIFGAGIVYDECACDGPDPECPECICSDQECVTYCAEYAREVPTLQPSPADATGTIKEVETLETLDTPETPPTPVDRRSQE